MADNTVIDAMSGGDTIATDDVASLSAKVQRMKVGFGTDGNYVDVSASDPLPISDNGGSLTVDGTVAVTGVSTAAHQVTAQTSLDAIKTAVEIIDNAVAGNEFQVDVITMPTVTIQDGGGSITVDGSVSISGTVTVSGTVAFSNTSINVADGGGSLTVDGTVAATQSGTWNVGTVTSITNPVAVTGTFWQATQPVSIASAVPITDNAGSLTVDAPVGTPVFVRLSDGSSAITTLPVSLASVPSHAVTNAGTFAVQVSAALPTGANVIGAVTQSGTWNVGTVTTVSAVTAITNALPAGTNNIGDVDVLTLPSIPAGTNNIGDVDILTIAAGSNLIGDVGIQGRTTGGLTAYKNLDVDESEDDIKSGAGTLYWLHVINLASTKRYLKIYDGIASGVTVGSTTPLLTLPIPTQGDSNGAGFTFNIPQGIAFSTGICIAATTGFADNDTGAPGANEVILNAAYK